MPISGVSNDGASCYHSSVSKTNSEQNSFSLNESEQKVQETESEEKKFPKNTLAELFEATGEVSCVNDNDSRPGRQVMWSKILSSDTRHI